jgi:hypothetical protein
VRWAHTSELVIVIPDLVTKASSRQRQVMAQRAAWYPSPSSRSRSAGALRMSRTHAFCVQQLIYELPEINVFPGVTFPLKSSDEGRKPTFLRQQGFPPCLQLSATSKYRISHCTIHLQAPCEAQPQSP